MKKGLMLSLICFSLLVVCFFTVSCGDKEEPHTDISVSAEFIYEDGSFNLTVPSNVSSYDLKSKIELFKKATISVSKTMDFKETLDASKLALDYGNNSFYVKVTNKKVEDQTYRFIIYRNPMLTVKFNTNGGSLINDVKVEGGTIIEAPISVKTGYDLKWDYDFSQPVKSSITINAIWTAKNYKVTITSEEMEVEDISFDVAFDSDYNFTDKVPQKAGYRFNGLYYKESNLNIDFSAQGKYSKADDITLYAKYEPIEYSITYMIGKGVTNPNTTSKFTVEDVINLQDAQWKDDEMTFAGWYTSEDYNEASKVTQISNASQNITLWPKFVPTVFTSAVKCYVDDTMVYEYSLAYGSNYTLDMPTIEAGYKFDGWYIGEELVDLNGQWQKKDASISLTAKISVVNNSIIYNLPQGAKNNSENPAVYNVEMGVVSLQAPSFGNHIFQGWYLDANFTASITELNVNNATNGMTIYSKWQYVTKVTYDAGEGTCAKTEDTFNYGSEYSLPIAEKLGYTFVGWYYGDIEVNSIGKWLYKESSIELVAKYEARQDDIVYILPSGATSTNPTEYNVELGEIELVDAEFGNHIFEGWYLDANFENRIYKLTAETVTNNMTIYSKWQYVTKVTFNADGGISTKSEDIYKYGQEIALPSAEKAGYKFIGWQYGEELIDSADFWAYKDAEMVLVAKYVLNENEIIYNLPNGAINNRDNSNLYTIEMGTITLKNPTFGDHIFEGWYLDSSFKTAVTELNIYNVTNGMTIYSKWQYVSNVKFDLNGSTNTIEDTQYLYGQAYTLPTPVKAGCLFEGWYYGDVKVVSGEWKYIHDVTLIANWVPTTIAINYELNGGTQNPENPETFDVHTGVITLKDPTNTNSDLLFAGWYTDINFTNRVTEIDTAVVREIILYAKWIGTNIYVKLDANSGYVSGDSQTILYGSAYSLNVPERVGYTFDGWYYNNQKIENVGTWTIISDNVTLVAKWSTEKYTITYNLGGASQSDIYGMSKDSEGKDVKVDISFVTEYNVNSSDIVVPKLYRDGYIFLGWNTSNGLVQQITIPAGSVGDRAYTASWCENTDSNKFVFELVDNQMVCIGYTAEPSAKQSVDLPSHYNGYPVTAIATNAFSDFGVKFGKSSYKNQNYYFTITIPKTIRLIQVDAFAECNGICVSLRDENGNILDFKSEDELKEWEKNVDYSSGKVNKQVRDCIWGFRPAIGWTRFSAVVIPDDYE